MSELLKESELKGRFSKWSRRSFGRFAAMVTAAVAVCRPRLTTGPVNTSKKVARHWKNSRGKSEN